jgi:predicted nuclease with TOPRIM domain
LKISLKQLLLQQKIGRLNELRSKIQERKNELLDFEVEKDKLEKIMEKENYDDLRKEYDSLLKKYGEIKAIIDERKRKLDEKRDR